MDTSAPVGAPPGKPVLIFDGDCGFCRYWIARWRHRTGDKIEYRPFQDPEIAQRFPELPTDRLKNAVQLVEPDGHVFEGAHAVFRTLAVTGSRLPLRAYEQVPAVSAASERLYQTVARHRPFFSRITIALWGRGTGPSTYALASWLFLRLMGVVYLVAFWSLGTQILGLIGHDGILPADAYMAAVGRFADARQLGPGRLFLMPTLGWLSTSDAFLKGLCVAGGTLASLLVVGVAPAVVLPLLWLLYLSLTVVCREFLGYQWDALLLEAGLLAIFVAPLTRWDRLRRAVDPPRSAVWLLRWLLFRLMFGSWIVKLASGDPTWHGLTALAVHYETQPLPTPIAWYAHHLPFWFQRTSTAVVLAIELVTPWFLFAPRRLRSIACAVLVALQLVIALTGNYAFFNLLAIGLCLLLLDDEALVRIARVFRRQAGGEQAIPLPRWPRVRWPRWILGAVALVTIPVSAVTLFNQAGVDIPGSIVVAPLANALEPFRSINPYGLFAVMTTTRNEIILEGSDDNKTWLAYEFHDKPGDVRRPPPWVAPHQPRLDWQMWFAALGPYESQGWFRNFLVRLLQGSPDVSRLLARDPFPGHPPKFLRARLFRYRFADHDARRTDGVVWTRELVGSYTPTVSLQAP